MMNFKIVVDSSADIRSIPYGVPFGVAPLKIITSQKEYCDDGELDVHAMLDDLEKYKGRSGSACPNTEDWKKEFYGFDNIFCVTITSGLSGSYNSAHIAANEYINDNLKAKVFVIDSLSTGPEIAMVVEKLAQLIENGNSFEDIKEQILSYKNTTHLIFALESMHNLANNGRINHVVAKFAGALGIRVIGKASLQGTLEMTDRSRGSKKMIADIIKNMSSNGYAGGRVRIHHCENPSAASELKERILKACPKADIDIAQTGALCSFYAERGGLIIGYTGKSKT